MRDFASKLWGWLSSLPQKIQTEATRIWSSIQAGASRLWTASKAGATWLKGFFVLFIGFVFSAKIVSAWKKFGDLVDWVPNKVETGFNQLGEILQNTAAGQAILDWATHPNEGVQRSYKFFAWLPKQFGRLFRGIWWLIRNSVFTRLFVIGLMALLFYTSMNAAGNWLSIQLDQRAYDASISVQGTEYECVRSLVSDLGLSCAEQNGLWTEMFVCDIESNTPCPAQFEILVRQLYADQPQE